MAVSTKEHPPLVSLHTDHDTKSVEIRVAGKGGTLSLSVRTDGPTIAVRDPARRVGCYKAVACLLANGHLKGWFVEQKGATPQEDTFVFFPARKKRKTSTGNSVSRL